MTEATNIEMPEIPLDQMGKYLDMFIEADTDASGYLDKKEFITFMMNQGASKKIATLTYRIIDQNHDKQIEFEEFATFLKCQKDRDQRAYLNLVFNALDKEKNGSLNKKQFQKFLDLFGIPYTPQTIKTVMDTFDADHSGTIEFAEILAFLGLDK